MELLLLAFRSAFRNRLRALLTCEPALSVVTTVRSDANRKSASATLHIVSTVRSLCRRRLASTRGRYFIAPPPAPPWW